MCPRCHQNAPLVYRGVNAFCTACGGPRLPLTNASLNMAGQPSKVGGTVARVFGWMVLAAGWLVGLAIFGLFAAAFGTSSWGLGIGGTIALVASLAAWGLLRGGKELQKSGDDAELAAQHQAIYALANTRHGVLKAWDVAQALHVSPEAGDAILTGLAKTRPEHVMVDIDDDGNVLYRFHHAGGQARIAPNAVAPHVRVGAPVRVDAREPVYAEAPEGDPEAIARRTR